MKREAWIQMAVALAVCLALALVGIRILAVERELREIRITMDRAIEELYMGDGMWFFLEEEPPEGLTDGAFG